MKNSFEGPRYGSYRDGDRRRAEDILYGRAAPQPPKKKGKKKKRSSFSILKLLFMTLILLLLVGIGAVSAGVAWYIVKISADLPSMVEVANPKSSVASILYDRNNKVIARLFIENRTPLELHQVSPWLVKAVLAAEDSAFYQHGGIRIGSILRALWIDLVEHGKVQGASTITQQLARNLFLSHEKSVTRKAKEIIIAMRMEKLFSKDKLLELYLNTINFGRGAWGAEIAARTYFGKSASELDIAQSSILAGLIANPGRYNPLSNLANAKARQNYVLSRMELLGWISAEQRQQAYAEELKFARKPNRIEEFNLAPYFVSHLLFNDLLPKYGKDEVYSGGMHIYTTLDLDLQNKAREAVNSLPTMGALVCLAADTGEVLALVGGKDFKTSKFNRATQAFRQPGSSFKPIVYAAALEEDIMPSDHFMDAPITFGGRGGNGRGWSPKNSSGKYAGEVTLQKALSSSFNTVAVRVAAYIGTENVVKMARSAGIETKHLPSDLSVALGAASLTPLEMAVAFNCFNNGGKRVTPLTIREIRDNEGNVLETRSPQLSQAMRPSTAYTIRSMLQDAVRAGTGTRARVPNVDTFGKTGTSNDFIDAWFVGGTPGLTTAVYVGNDDHTSMGRKGFGGTMAAPAWQAFMAYAVKEQKTPSSFANAPDWAEVTRVSICRNSGYLAAGGCPAVPLYFPSGKAPTAKCPYHGGSYEAADEDPRGPRLFLIEQDEAYLDNSAEESQEEHTTPQQVNPSVIPAPSAPAPYRHDPSPADEVEKRYQQLLKEYGID
ncbi:PBP1A family penicillin-binding protein [uncultured Fretibacterium sp.]|uniref:penicillin-binding protein 1A n=1 Tax=uncultured Fretibacterium sp. TaxID=1678694 RepID=UPI002613A4B6|nr:PBP1A family penicillin-binding protein [uncultured Fretibacterium sp.]